MQHPTARSASLPARSALSAASPRKASWDSRRCSWLAKKLPMSATASAAVARSTHAEPGRLDLAAPDRPGGLSQNEA